MESQNRSPRDDSHASPTYGTMESSSQNHVSDEPQPKARRLVTARGVIIGLFVGSIICFSNMYAGLQTGWCSPMTLPASLLGFGIAKGWQSHVLPYLEKAFFLLRKSPSRGSSPTTTTADEVEDEFTPEENVFIQTVASSAAMMPIVCGLVGVVPALEFLLEPGEYGDGVETNPGQLTVGKLLLWSMGLCYFGVFFAVPLRKQLIVREKLPFPSGFSTAVMISVLHRLRLDPSPAKANDRDDSAIDDDDEEPMSEVDKEKAARKLHRYRGLLPDAPQNGSLRKRYSTSIQSPITPTPLAAREARSSVTFFPPPSQASEEALSSLSPTSRRESISSNTLLLSPPPIRSHSPNHSSHSDSSTATERNGEDPILRSQLWLLFHAYLASTVVAFVGQLFPIIRDLPIFGPAAATQWLWTFNPSLAYAGQGIVMGTETTMHMLLGAIVGWGVLSPMAKYRGWAPGPVDDYETGSRGWIVSVSLAIMMSDAIVNLLYWVFRPSSPKTRADKQESLAYAHRQEVGEHTRLLGGHAHDDHDHTGDSARPSTTPTPTSMEAQIELDPIDDDDEEDAPVEDKVSPKTVWIGLGLTVLLCVVATHIVFAPLVPLHASFLAVLVALTLSVMGARAMGETDLNPVSGISKLAQIFFALVVTPPGSGPMTHHTAVLVNLVAGSSSEAGSMQASELLLDIKTGHVLGAAPRSQFWGQMIGSTWGAGVSVLVYRLYTRVYSIPNEYLPVPSAYVWILTARMVTSKGLMPHVSEWALGAGLMTAVVTVLRILLLHGPHRRKATHPWRKFLPSGIAFSIGFYNVPSFTLARAVGGLFGWWWMRRRSHGRSEAEQSGARTRLIVMASGFILGEGVFSILALAYRLLANAPA